MDREYYIFRYFDDKDVMRMIHEEFKCMTEAAALSYASELQAKYYGVAMYKRVPLRK